MQNKMGKLSTEEIEKEAGVKWDSIYRRLKREGLLETLNEEAAEGEAESLGKPAGNSDKSTPPDK